MFHISERFGVAYLRQGGGINLFFPALEGERVSLGEAGWGAVEGWFHFTRSESKDLVPESLQGPLAEAAAGLPVPDTRGGWLFLLVQVGVLGSQGRHRNLIPTPTHSGDLSVRLSHFVLQILGL